MLMSEPNSIKVDRKKSWVTRNAWVGVFLITNQNKFLLKDHNQIQPNFPFNAFVGDKDIVILQSTQTIFIQIKDGVILKEE